MARMAEPAHAISRGLLWAEFAALYIGAPLGIALFMPGRLLFPAIRDGLDGFERAVAAVQRQRAANIATLSSTVAFVAKRLAPRAGL